MTNDIRVLIELVLRDRVHVVIFAYEHGLVGPRDAGEMYLIRAFDGRAHDLLDSPAP